METSCPCTVFVDVEQQVNAERLTISLDPSVRLWISPHAETVHSKRDTQHLGEFG